MPSTTSLFAGDVQFHADHQAKTAHLFDEREMPAEFPQFLPEAPAHVVDLSHQFVQDFEELEGHAASQRSPAKGGSVHSQDRSPPRPFRWR